MRQEAWLGCCCDLDGRRNGIQAIFLCATNANVIGKTDFAPLSVDTGQAGSAGMPGTAIIREIGDAALSGPTLWV